MIRYKSLSQNPLSFFGSLSFFPSITTAENVLDFAAESQKENAINKTIDFIPCLVSEAKNYAAPNYIPFGFSLLTQNNSLETVVVSKLEKIDKVKKIYLDEQSQFADIKIFLEMPTYDYDLINKILNEIEFPIKDTFKNKLIDFEYLPFTEEDKSIDTGWKLIFNRDVNEMIFNPYSDFSYEDPLNNIPLVNVNLRTNFL
ncbi:MAG: hypothetical protein HYW62_04380 [Candidatus Levybacteria bacterium]|nr:hypothetical protein [Candidatus Levybacteria bacterium]